MDFTRLYVPDWWLQWLQSFHHQNGHEEPALSSRNRYGPVCRPLYLRSVALHLEIDPEKWARRADVKDAWHKLWDKYHLDHDSWDFLTFAFGRNWSCVGNMTKAWKFGWTGYADTWEELEAAFEILEKKKILPPVEQLKSDFSWSPIARFIYDMPISGERLLHGSILFTKIYRQTSPLDRRRIAAWTTK